MCDTKPLIIFPDEMRPPVTSELTDILSMARGGHQPDPSARQAPDIDDMVRRGRKYGVTAEPATDPFDSDYACPACGSNDNPDRFNGRCPACGHEPE